VIRRDPSGADELALALRDARERTLSLVRDLTDQELAVPYLPIVNPVLWELGHVAWFQEKWVLRRDGRPALDPRADALFDSAAVRHETRWTTPLLPRAETLRYMERVLDLVLEGLMRRAPTPEELYFLRLVLYHEDMHGEAFVYTRQTLGYAAPACGPTTPAGAPAGGEAHPGDAEIPGGVLRLGAEREAPFVFDNEQWAHEVEVLPFRLALAPVTQAEYQVFVEDRGYERPELWTRPGWRWRTQSDARHPVYWRREGDLWLRRHFDRWVALEPHRPVLHVNAFEAEAYARWAGRRLPLEAEWEFAAGPARNPWGDCDPTPEHAQLDLTTCECVEVGACPQGDGPFGNRQLVGNVWEWTATPFRPYPGFAPGPYREYSQPWFETHRVLRGGAYATRARLLRNTWRNFFTPDRRDVLAGFRTATSLA
jgi:iron(II)-dependent oxidoreductase